MAPLKPPAAGRATFTLLAVLALTLAQTAAPAFAAPAKTTRVSVSSAGVAGNDRSFFPAISAGGRFVAFSSDASNLVAGDTNDSTDVFVRDRRNHTTSRVSVGAGTEGNLDSYDPSISANGRFVAFSSDASNLVSGDTNDSTDVFVRDRVMHTTMLVSVSSGGVLGNSVSSLPSISGGGRLVAFASFSSNLVGADTNAASDIFVRNLRTHTTRRASVSSAGVEADFDSADPAISADGRYVAFDADATNLVAADTNDTTDVFVRDLRAHATHRVSVGTQGAQANSDSHGPSISADGRLVAFHSYASNLVAADANGAADVFVHTLTTGTTSRVSVSGGGGEANSDSFLPSVSADGRFIAFYSDATNLVAGDTNRIFDVFVRDRANHATTRVSLSSGAVQGNGSSYDPAISADGRVVAFYSDATNLVGGDTNAAGDILVRGPLAP
jgi:Tol biopolymer transport system component